MPKQIESKGELDMTEQKGLVLFLAELDSEDSDSGVFVRRGSITVADDAYTVLPFCYEPHDNDGIDYTGWECVGTLEELSCGGLRRDKLAILREIASSIELVYNGSVVRFNAEAMYEALIYERLDADFAVFLNEVIEAVGVRVALVVAQETVAQIERNLFLGKEWIC